MNNAPESVADTEATDEVERLISGVAKMRLELDTLGLSSKGNKETLAKRLKKAQKSALTAANEVTEKTSATERYGYNPMLPTLIQVY